MQVEWSELATVVSGTDRQDSRSAGGANADARRGFHGVERQAIEDDFVDAIASFGQIGAAATTQRRAECIVGAGAQILVFAADLTPASNDAAGKRGDHIR